MTSLAAMLHQTPYAGYTYAYPHKTAYRPLHPPRPLRDLWAAERRDAPVPGGRRGTARTRLPLARDRRDVHDPAGRGLLISRQACRAW